jgi:hypothetical protein
MVENFSLPGLRQFVDDELMRVPLLVDQLVDGTIDTVRKALVMLPGPQRMAMADLVSALQVQRPRLGDYFLRSLREQVLAKISRQLPESGPRHEKRLNITLELVDDDEVALEVEMSHTIQAVKRVAEYELRELQTFISAMVGDMDVAADHNPFRPEIYARALWAGAQALPLSRGHQIAFMRHAAEPLAQLLRMGYAAACSRLESMGFEPAAHRTMVLPSGSRRGGRGNDITFSPDMLRIRDSMPAPLDSAPERPRSREETGSRRSSPGRTEEHWSDIARGTSNRVDRQSIELVSRLFDAMQAEDRLPADVKTVIARLHGSAMRLTLGDSSVLDQDRHALWLFINRVAFEAEMAPDPADPERALLLKYAQGIAEQLAREPKQHAGLYRWALDRFEAFMQKRLTRRLASAASQIGALQKLEEQLTAGQPWPSSGFGTIDSPQLDTVPAELLATAAPAAPSAVDAENWLSQLRIGDWVRVFLEGRWIHARLLWLGTRHEIWLFGDGASDSTWAVRRGALMSMRSQGLAKTLRQRSYVSSAAARVQDQLGKSAAA